MPLLKELTFFTDFLATARRRLRFSDLSRETLQVVRIEWRGDLVECDWLMRPGDQWDSHLSVHVAETNQTLQALRDALTVRETVFETFSAVSRAELRMYRPKPDYQCELMLSGSVSRMEEDSKRVASIAMRARLCGFHFILSEGVLQPMEALDGKST
jgi:hypothetical protein